MYLHTQFGHSSLKIEGARASRAVEALTALSPPPWGQVKFFSLNFKKSQIVTLIVTPQLTHF